MNFIKTTKTAEDFSFIKDARESGVFLIEIKESKEYTPEVILNFCKSKFQNAIIYQQESRYWDTEDNDTKRETIYLRVLYLTKMPIGQGLTKILGDQYADIDESDKIIDSVDKTQTFGYYSQKYDKFIETGYGLSFVSSYENFKETEKFIQPRFGSEICDSQFKNDIANALLQVSIEKYPDLESLPKNLSDKVNATKFTDEDVLANKKPTAEKYISTNILGVKLTKYDKLMYIFNKEDFLKDKLAEIPEDKIIMATAKYYKSLSAYQEKEDTISGEPAIFHKIQEAIRNTPKVNRNSKLSIKLEINKKSFPQWKFKDNEKDKDEKFEAVVKKFDGEIISCKILAEDLLYCGRLSARGLSAWSLKELPDGLYKDTYGRTKRNWLDDYQPSDIVSISFNRKTIYSR